MQPDVRVSTDLPSEVANALREFQLLADDEIPASVRLEGGVSSEIWKVESRGGIFCVKRALAKLAVPQDWRAPVIRNRYERLWCQTVRRYGHSWAPEILAYSDNAGLFVMNYYNPTEYWQWKHELAEGRVDVVFATSVASAIAQIHAMTADKRDIAQAFDTDELFESLRLDPYLRSTAHQHPDCAARLNELAEQTSANKLALVHGDVSPKNILHGPAGPVFLDSECAWYGDPAFDAAFCLNHLLLKCLWLPSQRVAFLDAFQAFATAYLAQVSWESPQACQARISALLPALLLARIDGKSPVEYIQSEVDKNKVRKLARKFLNQPTDQLNAIRQAWHQELM